MIFTLVEITGLIILSILTVLTILNFVNIMSFKKVGSPVKADFNNLISVLIPARNEEDTIEECVNSVLNQTYKNFELIVLNDNSTDKTESILNSISLKDNRLKIIKGKSLPADWVGKNYACHQLQMNSTGEYMLFLDSDTIMSEDCIYNSINFAVKNNADLLSLMPYEETKTFWEKVIIPMLYFAVLVFLPLRMIERSKSKKYAMGNGQFMLFKKSFYDKIGGHEALKNRIVEDVWLARRTKEFGGKLIFADGTDILKCRMYKNFNEVWNGFSKNFFAGLSFSVTGLILVNLLYLILFILPLFLLLYGLIVSNLFLIYISIILIILPVIIRMSHSVYYKQPFWFSFLNILSSVMLILLSLNSFRIIRFGKGANWKGRDYKEDTIKS